MKTFLALILFVGSASTSLAFDGRSGYVAKEHTCAELQSILQSEGQITLQRRFGSLTYYADRSVCQRGTEWVPVRATVRTQDTRRCFVGYRCQFNGGANVQDQEL